MLKDRGFVGVTPNEHHMLAMTYDMSGRRKGDIDVYGLNMSIYGRYETNHGDPH